MNPNTPIQPHSSAQDSQGNPSGYPLAPTRLENPSTGSAGPSNLPQGPYVNQELNASFYRPLYGTAETTGARTVPLRPVVASGSFAPGAAPANNPGAFPAPQGSTSTATATQAPPPNDNEDNDDAAAWKCPHCTYVQRNHRHQELRRHIRTHAEPTAAGEPFWICCGVPLAEAAARGVPLEIIAEIPFVYNGRQFVGGCRRMFSRRDALARHLRRFETFCYGDQYGQWLRGNQEGTR
ncbi:uncharacterized protein TRAVEDRAFT_48792 [Trametes versicolor FP-101664 SS1]|uniref:uncharacterized protein n=1 Tax=Trametes versicolor (strain FP-101664) TaxID=717944 RepID=UPI0004623EBB|nr:uncharacterized protein TRAVEDRAFT_48792 [Trametes versicolor FP-101664 SS1]EIW57762.1 hypothetical protein TRAVEDRAFT_48792 [Trametes versicolor FP-101664 SS1]